MCPCPQSVLIVSCLLLPNGTPIAPTFPVPTTQLCVLVGSPCPAWSVASALAHQDTGRLLQALRVLQPSILSARRKHIIANVLLGRQLAPCTPEVEAQLVSKLRAT